MTRSISNQQERGKAGISAYCTYLLAMLDDELDPGLAALRDSVVGAVVHFMVAFGSVVSIVSLAWEGSVDGKSAVNIVKSAICVVMQLEIKSRQTAATLQINVEGFH